MNRRPRLYLNLCAILMLAAFVFVFAFAGSSRRILADGPGAGGDYVLESSVLDGGVGAMSSDQYVLQGSFGQPTANGLLTANDLQVSLGFWSPITAFQAYLPIVTK